MSQWYAYVAGAQYGPVPWETLRSWAADGRVGRGDFVWTPGMDDWLRADSVDGLFTVGTSSGIPQAVMQIPSKGGTGGQSRNSDITAAARRRLRGNWGLPIAFCLLMWLMQMAAGGVPYVGLLAGLILTGPFTLGSVVFFLTFVRGGEGDLGMLFSGFLRFGRALCAHLWIYLLVVLWGIGGAIAGMVVSFFISLAIMFTWGPAGASVYPVLSGLFVGYSVAAVVAGLAYSQAFYIIADRPEVGAVEAVSMSREMMAGRKAKLFFLSLRFVGWAILCVFTFFIGFLWLIPYMSTAYAYFYEDLQQPRGGGTGPDRRPQAGAEHPPSANDAAEGQGDYYPPDEQRSSQPPSDQWHYIGRDGVEGPVDRYTLRRLVRNRRVPPDALVWQPGRDVWACATMVDGLLDGRTRRRPELTLPRPAAPGTGGRTPNSEIVTRAMEALEGARLKPALFCTLALMVTLAAAVLFRAGVVLAFLLAGQFLFAAALFCLTLVRGGKVRVGMASAGFRRPIRALAGYLGSMVIVLPQAVGGWLVGMLLGAVAGVLWWVVTDTAGGLGSSWLWGGCIGAGLAATGAWLSYSQVPFLMVDHPERSVLRILRDSAEMMHGHQGRYFRLCLRFVGWGIAVVFSFGIGGFWLVPIMGAAAATFYEDLRSAPEQAASVEAGVQAEREPAAAAEMTTMVRAVRPAPKNPPRSLPKTSTMTGP